MEVYKGSGATMSVKTLEFDPRTDEIIDDLKRAFRVTSTADVIRRAIALADQARRCAEPGSVIVLSGQHGDTKIDLAS
jgi:hypothetical protein